MPVHEDGAVNQQEKLLSHRHQHRGKELSGRRDKECVGGPSLSPSSRLRAGDVIND